MLVDVLVNTPAVGRVLRRRHDERARGLRRRRRHEPAAVQRHVQQDCTSECGDGTSTRAARAARWSRRRHANTAVCDGTCTVNDRRVRRRHRDGGETDDRARRLPGRAATSSSRGEQCDTAKLNGATLHELGTTAARHVLGHREHNTSRSARRRDLRQRHGRRRGEQCDGNAINGVDRRARSTPARSARVGSSTPSTCTMTSACGNGVEETATELRRDGMDGGAWHRLPGISGCDPDERSCLFDTTHCCSRSSCCSAA